MLQESLQRYYNLVLLLSSDLTTVLLRVSCHEDDFLVSNERESFRIPFHPRTCLSPLGELNHWHRQDLLPRLFEARIVLFSSSED